MKTILITGATSGFGKVAAGLLATDNKLILLGRRQDRLDELAKTLGSQVYCAAVDVDDKKQVAAFFKDLPAGFRDIDVLVNSAGLALGMAPAQEADLDDWEQMVETNIKGLLRVTRPVLDIMAKRGTG